MAPSKYLKTTATLFSQDTSKIKKPWFHTLDFKISATSHHSSVRMYNKLLQESRCATSLFSVPPFADCLQGHSSS